MTNNQKKAEILAKAKEAEEFASRASDAEQRESWFRIAAAYYQLAERHHDDERSVADLVDASPSPTSQTSPQS
jgi:hypothetical protein